MKFTGITGTPLATAVTATPRGVRRPGGSKACPGPMARALCSEICSSCFVTAVAFSPDAHTGTEDRLRAEK